jgi:hypothetical protein
VNDVAAKPGFSGRQRRQLRTSRLVQYTLLQALIVVVCILVLREPPPEPDSRYCVTAFSLKEGGAERSVTLPHFTSSRFSMDDPPLYAGSFSWTSSGSQQAWSVFLPRFSNGVEVAVNDVVILDSRRDPAPNRPDRNAPEIPRVEPEA